MIEVIDADLQTPVPWKNAVVTMGAFDGFHIGHQKLIQRCQQKAKELHLPAVLVTFDPSPKQVLGKLAQQNVIFCRKEKVRFAKFLGLDAIVFIPFSKTISQLSPKDFVLIWLVKYLKTKYFVIGFDHRFGYRQEGDFSFLQEHRQEFQFESEQVKKQNYFWYEVSSSGIRKLLHEGNVKKVNQFLNFYFFVIGKIVQGKGRGKGLGFPTANIKVLENKLLPQDGVYFCLVLLEGRYHRAVANIGKNPTFNNEDRTLEIHILNFQQDVYQKEIVLFLIKKLRNEIKFSAVEALKQQIHKDVQSCHFFKIPSTFKKPKFTF